MNRKDVIKEVTEFITENIAEDDNDVDLGALGSQLEEHLTSLEDEEDSDEDDEDDGDDK